MKIYESTKFHHARRQFRAEVGGFTVLRLTYGRNGGAIKTATAKDDSGARVYPDRESLIDATKAALVRIGGSASDVEIRLDGAHGPFGEVRGTGSEREFICVLARLAEEVGVILGLQMAEAA